MFKRRIKRRIFGQIRQYLWPSGGWRRFFHYQWLRMKRLNASPQKIARGFVCGVFASFTPLVGLHLLICFTSAFVVRGSFIASAIGTFVGNPLTFPLIWISTYKLGSRLLGAKPVDPHLETASMNIWNHLNSVDSLVSLWETRLMPMLVGGVPMGLVAAVVMYFPIEAAVSRYQLRRQQRLAARAQVSQAVE